MVCSDLVATSMLTRIVNHFALIKKCHSTDILHLGLATVLVCIHAF